MTDLTWALLMICFQAQTPEVEHVFDFDTMKCYEYNLTKD